MIFRKNLKAGTLLYALLMLGIFALLLQFYIQSQLATGQISQVSQKESQAYFMAQMTKDAFLKSQPEWSIEDERNKATDERETMSKEASSKEKSEETAEIPDEKKTLKKGESPVSGQISFRSGQASYEKRGQNLHIKVQLGSGQNYHYHFPISSEN